MKKIIKNKNKKSSTHLPLIKNNTVKSPSQIKHYNHRLTKDRETKKKFMKNNLILVKQRRLKFNENSQIKI